MCLLGLQNLAQSLALMAVPPLPPLPNIAPVAAMASQANFSAQMSMGSMLSVVAALNLPPLPLPPLALANLAATAAAVTAIQSGLGIDPFAADAAASMAMAITTLQANLARIGPFAVPAGLASLASLASSMQTIRMSLGINPLVPGAIVGIKAALAVPPLAAVQFTTPPAQIASYAIASTGSIFGSCATGATAIRARA